MEMAAAIYWPQGSTQVPTTPAKSTRKSRTRKGKLTPIWKGQQEPHPLQQSNARREEMQRSVKIKRNLVIRPIALQPNGYDRTINRKNKMRRTVNCTNLSINTRR